MSEYKLTDWIEPHVRPKIPGWYERQWTLMDSRRECMDYWDGSFWRHGDGNYYYRADFIGADNIPWRGLAEDPNKKD